MRTPLFRVLSKLVGRQPLTVLVIVLPLACFPPVSHATPPAVDPLPWPTERLVQPLSLPHCAPAVVVEWKPTTAFLDETTPTPRALSVIDDACRVALDRYPSFLRERHLPMRRSRPDFLPALSLLPGNVLVDGKDFRNLNDLPHRFGAVAQRCCFWGLYVDALNHVFLRNDPLLRDWETGSLEPNPRFIRTLQHELSHVLSARLGVWDLVGYDGQKDEELAEDFVGYLGIPFKTESCSEDLARHKGRT